MPCGICWLRLVILGLRSTSRTNCPHPWAHPSPSAAIRAINGRRELVRFGKARHFVVLFLNYGLLWREKFIHLRFKSHQNMANPIFPVQLFQVKSEKKKQCFFGMVNQILLSLFVDLFCMKFIVSYSEGVFSITFQLLSSQIFMPPIEPLTDVGRCLSHMPPGTVHDDTSDLVQKNTDPKCRWQNQKKKRWHNFIWNVYLADL